MITVHHLEHSRSQRILWLLEELGIEYDIKLYRREPDTSLAPASLESVHPLGKSPVITDGDTTVAESGAIIEYLVDRYGEGRLKPADGTAAALAYRYWMHYAEGSLMPLMIVALIVGRVENAPMPFFARPVAKGIAGKIRGGYLDRNLQKHLGFLESTLAQSAWFCGSSMTAADIQMSFPLEAAEVRAGLADDYPGLSDFLARIRALPAYRRALARGGPFDLAAIGKR